MSLLLDSEGLLKIKVVIDKVEQTLNKYNFLKKLIEDWLKVRKNKGKRYVRETIYNFEGLFLNFHKYVIITDVKIEKTKIDLTLKYGDVEQIISIS